MALIDALQALPANIPAVDLWKRVQVGLEVEGITDQQPELDGSKRAETAATVRWRGRYRESARGGSQRVDQEVILDIGAVSDIGIGSEFVAVPQGRRRKGNSAHHGGRGHRSLHSHRGFTCGRKGGCQRCFRTGQMDSCQETEPVLLGARLSADPGADYLCGERGSIVGVRLVNDPSREAWSYLISWDGSQWTMQKAVVRGADPFGRTLTADLIKRKLSKRRVVWLNLPPAAELSTPIADERSNQRRANTANEAQAMYVLAGTVTESGPAYTWYNRGELIAGRQTPAGYGNGCSADSPYPIRTEWVPVSIRRLRSTSLQPGWPSSTDGYSCCNQAQPAAPNIPIISPYNVEVIRTTVEDKGKTQGRHVYQICSRPAETRAPIPVGFMCCQ